MTFTAIFGDAEGEGARVYISEDGQSRNVGEIKREVKVGMGSLTVRG